MRHAIEAGVAAVSFEAPITIEYCAAVRDAIRPLIAEAKLCVYWTGDRSGPKELVVEARLETAKFETKRCRVALPLA